MQIVKILIWEAPTRWSNQILIMPQLTYNVIRIIPTHKGPVHVTWSSWQLFNHRLWQWKFVTGGCEFHISVIFQGLLVAHAAGMPGTFFPPCGLWILTSITARQVAVSFEVGGGENVPGILGKYVTGNFPYLVRGPFSNVELLSVLLTVNMCICFGMGVHDNHDISRFAIFSITIFNLPWE